MIRILFQVETAVAGAAAKAKAAWLAKRDEQMKEAVELASQKGVKGEPWAYWKAFHEAEAAAHWRASSMSMFACTVSAPWQRRCVRTYREVKSCMCSDATAWSKRRCVRMFAGER